MMYYSIAPRIPPALLQYAVLSIGCGGDVLKGCCCCGLLVFSVGELVDGGGVQQEAKLQSKEGEKNQNLSSKKAANVLSGIQKRAFLLSGGA